MCSILYTGHTNVFAFTNICVIEWHLNIFDVWYVLWASNIRSRDTTWYRCRKYFFQAIYRVRDADIQFLYSNLNVYVKRAHNYDLYLIHHCVHSLHFIRGRWNVIIPNNNYTIQNWFCGVLKHLFSEKMSTKHAHVPKLEQRKSNICLSIGSLSIMLCCQSA